MTLHDLSELDRERAQKKNLSLSKEIDCVICGNRFTTKLMIERVGTVLLTGDFCYPNKCENCQRIIDEIDWFGHHKKEPTIKDLQRDLKNRIKYLQNLLTHIT